MKKIVLAALTLVLTLSSTLFGQAVYGSISGNVTDASGASVPQAKITVTDVGKGITYTTTANESGNYSQTHLIVGLYEVRVEAPGFNAYVQKNVHVEVDAVTTVSARMTVGSVGETVNVTAETPLLKSEKSDVSDTMTQKQIQEMPVFGRDLSLRVFRSTWRPGHRHDRGQRATSRHIPPHHRRPVLGGHLVPVGWHRQPRVGVGRTSHHTDAGFLVGIENHHHGL